VKEIIKKYLQHRRDYISRDNDKENEKKNNNKLIMKAKVAVKKSADVIAAAENNESDDDAVEKALAEAEGIVSEIERQLGK
jgi:hypothetical protein